MHARSNARILQLAVHVVNLSGGTDALSHSFIHPNYVHVLWRFREKASGRDVAHAVDGVLVDFATPGGPRREAHRNVPIDHTTRRPMRRGGGLGVGEKCRESTKRSGTHID